MFLHVGNNKNIRIKNIIGIFDMDNTTVSSVTRKYLTGKQKNALVESAAEDEIPKSFVLYRETDGNGSEIFKICFSQLSTASLMGRMNVVEQ